MNNHVIAWTSCLFLASVGVTAQQGTNPSPHQPVPADHPSMTSPHAPAERMVVPEARPEDVKSVDAIMAAMFASLSGEKGEERQWDRLRSLFLLDARLIASRPAEDGTATAWFMNVDDFIAFNRKYFEKGGYIETEAARKTEEFGNMAHVWSTYEARHSSADAVPYSRGIYSVQLFNDGTRWWIVNAFWDHERANLKIPDSYLPNRDK